MVNKGVTEARFMEGVRTTQKKSGPAIYFGLVPILLVFTLILFEHLSPSSVRIYEPTFLLPILNTSLFLAAFIIVYIAGRTYLISGSTTILWIGCGVLTLGLAALTAGWLIIPFGPNVNVTIFNVGAFLASICHIGAVVANLAERPRDVDPSHRKRNVLIGYLAVLFGIALLDTLAIAGLMPTFFIQGQGPTVLRQDVLSWAIALFVVSSLFTINLFRRKQALFLYWYSLALALLALALLAFWLQPAVGSPVGWVGRSAYVVAAIYFLLSVNSGLREARSLGLSPYRAIMQLLDPGLHWQSIMANVSDGVVSYNEKGEILLWNKAAERIFHYPEAEVMGKGFDLILPGMKALNPPSHNGGIAELALARQDGSRFDAEVSVSARSSALGVITTLVIRDVSERKRAEAALRESEDRFRAFMDNSPAVAWAKEETGRYVYLSKTYENRLGIRLADWQGKTDFEVWPQEIAEKFRENDLAVLASGQATEFIEETINPDGSRGYWWDFKFPFYDAASAKYVGGIAVDITEYQQAQEALRRAHEELEQRVTERTAELRQTVVQLQNEVTERHRAEVALSKHAALVHDLYNKAPCGYHSLDREGRFVRVNDTELAWLGYSREEMLGGMKFSDLLTANGSKMFQKSFPLFLERGWVRNIEYDLVRKDGSLLPVSVSASAIKDEAGNYLMSRGTIFDLTERRIVEAALRESEATLRGLLDANPESLLLVDKEMAVITANQTAAQRIGKRPDELIGAGLSDLIPGDLFHRRKPYLDEVFRTGQPVQFEDSREGINFYHYLYPLFDADGKVSRVAILALDITGYKRAEEALRESEEKYRGLIETTNTGYAITDTEGKILDANREFVRLTGYNEFKEIKGRSFLEWTAPQDRHKNAASLQQCLETGHVRYLELDYVGRDGRSIPVEVNATAINTSAGVKLLGLVRDITERRRVADENAKLEAQLVQGQKMEAIGTLAGGIAHDFNNILTAIIGNISLAMADLQMGEQGHERLIEAEKACMQAQNLSRQLLTFSRGGVPIKGIVSVKSLITESATFACRGSQVNYESSLPDNLWAVEADSVQISQVFQNLVINAVQAMPAGGMIKIQGENLEVATGSELPIKGGRYVKVTVQDEGIGIPAELLPRVFDPYFTTKQKGSGLGLATSYSIVRNHHGHIAVDSAVGKGTTFNVYLPASDQQVIQPPKEDREFLAGKGRILVMDDEAMIRDVLGKMLQSLGYEVRLAGDGAEAIEFFSQAAKSGEPFAAVILDITVPGGMGGKEAMARLLKIDPRVKAIVCSGYSEDPIMADFKKYGFTAVIAKPYKTSDLGKVLNMALAGKE